VLSTIPIYLAYIHSDGGHYNLAVEARFTENTNQTKTTAKEAVKQLPFAVDLPPQPVNVKMRCTCGRGAARMNGKRESCNSYKSRCPCFRAMKGCNANCSCRSCVNPFGSKCQEESTLTPLPRKRPRYSFQQDVAQTDEDFMKRKEEQLIPLTWLQDELYVFEALSLYMLVTKQNITPEIIFTLYHGIMKFCSEETT